MLGHQVDANSPPGVTKLVADQAVVVAVAGGFIGPPIGDLITLTEEDPSIKAYELMLDMDPLIMLSHNIFQICVELFGTINTQCPGIFCISGNFHLELLSLKWEKYRLDLMVLGFQCWRK